MGESVTSQGPEHVVPPPLGAVTRGFEKTVLLEEIIFIFIFYRVWNAYLVLNFR